MVDFSFSLTKCGKFLVCALHLIWIWSELLIILGKKSIENCHQVLVQFLLVQGSCYGYVFSPNYFILASMARHLYMLVSRVNGNVLNWWVWKEISMEFFMVGSELCEESRVYCVPMSMVFGILLPCMGLCGVWPLGCSGFCYCLCLQCTRFLFEMNICVLSMEPSRCWSVENFVCNYSWNWIF